MTERRLHRLLNHLSRTDFRPPPPTVGLKTMVRARIEGLIEMGSDLRKPIARITTAGERWRDEQSDRPREMGS
jgi:hypothetical protein